jgi:hypothetical protein
VLRSGNQTTPADPPSSPKQSRLSASPAYDSPTSVAGFHSILADPKSPRKREGETEQEAGDSEDRVSRLNVQLSQLRQEVKLDFIVDRLKCTLLSYLEQWRSIVREERVRMDQDDIHAATIEDLSEQLVSTKKESCRRVVLLCNRIGRESVLCAFRSWTQYIQQLCYVIETPQTLHLRKMLADSDDQLRRKDRELLLLKNALKMQLIANGVHVRPSRSPRADYSMQYDLHEWLGQHS